MSKETRRRQHQQYKRVKDSFADFERMIAKSDMRVWGAQWDIFITAVVGMRPGDLIRPSLYATWRVDYLNTIGKTYEKLYYKGLPKRIPRVEPYELSWYGESVLYPEIYIYD